LEPLAVGKYLAGLHGRVKAVTVHKHYRTLKAFFRWALESGLLDQDPLRGVQMKLPRVLPAVPERREVDALLKTPAATWEEKRNMAMVALFADSAVRRFELRRLRIEDVSFAECTFRIQGKGQKDRVGYFGATTARLLRQWVAVRVGAHPEDYLFCRRDGSLLHVDSITHILYKLSERAGLSRRRGPHALRHFSGTRILQESGDLELVRQVLGHESLAMALRYARLTGMDVSKKFRRVSPLDNL